MTSTFNLNIEKVSPQNFHEDEAEEVEHIFMGLRRMKGMAAARQLRKGSTLILKSRILPILKRSKDTSQAATAASEKICVFGQNPTQLDLKPEYYVLWSFPSMSLVRGLS